MRASTATLGQRHRSGHTTVAQASSPPNLARVLVQRPNHAEVPNGHVQPFHVGQVLPGPIGSGQARQARHVPLDEDEVLQARKRKVMCEASEVPLALVLFGDDLLWRDDIHRVECRGSGSSARATVAPSRPCRRRDGGGACIKGVELVQPPPRRKKRKGRSTSRGSTTTGTLPPPLACGSTPSPSNVSRDAWRTESPRPRRSTPPPAPAVPLISEPRPVRRYLMWGRPLGTK